MHDSVTDTDVLPYVAGTLAASGFCLSAKADSENLKLRWILLKGDMVLWLMMWLLSSGKVNP